ncbi:MAG TPA: SPOR domain-containing protein [Candidatus Sulfotelmatobacter sp.]|nr:SPOR domain-containing protein [Candidatus Sulfotelmatobacter sp.]
MASSQDTEITLGTGKLLLLFFGLVGICALFFGLGYSLGRKSEPTIAAASTAVPQTSNTGKASGGSTGAAPPMTFYKAVEQKDATPELTPPADPKTDTKTDTTAAPPPANTTSGQAPASNSVDPTTTLPSGGYFVQVAAVSKQEDADALVDALKKKDYPAFVASGAATDKLFRVQLGPFSEIKDAEAMRTKLMGDGYSPILKK